MFRTTVCCLPLAVLLAVLSTRSPAADWPQFRGPSGQGHSTARDVPVSWTPESNIAWKTAIDGNGWSSPVTRGELVYLTTAVPAPTTDGPTSLRVICLQVDSGVVIWNVEIAQIAGATEIHPKNSHASATPIVTDERVYVHFAAHGTAALNHDGQVQWSRTIEYMPRHGTGSSPVLFDDLLIMNCDGEQSPFVIALDSATGTERWRTPRPELAEKTFSFSTPLTIEFEGTTQLISPGSGLVASYHPTTGKQLWMVRYPNRFSVVPRPACADGLVLVSTGYEGPPELLAIKPSGSGDVTESHVAWRADRFVPHNPSPLIHEGRIYLVSDRGIASCRNLQTGELIWKERLGGNFSASPVVAENRVYFLSEAGVCSVVRAAPRFELLARNDLQERALASMAAVDGGLLIRTMEGLYRIGSARPTPTVE